MQIQVLGLCRFSLLIEGGYKRAPDDMEARAAFLFDPRRLAMRFAWFRNVTLPALRAQTEKDFRFVVLTSEALPEPWRSRLLEMVAAIPQIEVDFAAPGPHHRVANDALRRRFSPDADLIAQFRIDDDDAVARDYVERVHADFVDGLAPLHSRFGMVALDHVRGLILDADAHQARLFQTWMLNWNCAQTVYFPPDERRALFDFGHHRLHASMPTVTMGDSNMYVHGRHGTNDSQFDIPRFDTRPWDMGALQRRFDICIDALQADLRAAEAVTGAAPISAGAPRHWPRPAP